MTTTGDIGTFGAVLAVILLKQEIWSSRRRCIVLVILILATCSLDFPSPCSAQNLDGNYTCSGNGTNRVSITDMLYKLRTESSKTGFYEYSSGTGADKVYGSYLCQGDISNQNCSDCVKNANDDIISHCPNQVKAQIRYDKCFLQYSGKSFFGELVDDYIVWCNPYSFEDAQVAEFSTVLNDTLTKVAKQAAADQTPLRKFATREVNLTFNGSSTMYTLAQCMPDLSPALCLRCLSQIIRFKFPQWCQGKLGGRTISSSCTIRYEMGRFYAEVQNPAPAPAPAPTSAPASTPTLALPILIPPPSKGKRGPPVLEIVGITTSVVVLIMLLALGMSCYLRKQKALNDFEGIDMQEITTAESIQMDFNKVRVVTQNFSADKKLGEGGFGDVFKGKMENGQEIAVKRLTTTNSGQGAAEFKNEVVLVAKLQHRNLVKLLEFCLSGKEKILVYEYLPNSSLDKVLFDPIKKASLDWEKRFNIICGIAKGLLYLHEDSRLRIIHRDLKSSNILLDEAMNPKISDFGIAKTLALDQTRDSTESVAGTYGYMAPEYVLTGQYSLKSDVYSFGIMVLEIVTGQRNRFHGRPLLEEALLHRAWRLWNENAELEMVDSALNEAYLMEEVIKCIHIGLLCIQEDAGKRPKMTSVVYALSGKSIDLPAPTPPNFFNISCSISITTGSSISATTSTTTITTTTTKGTTQSSLLPTHVDD